MNGPRRTHPALILAVGLAMVGTLLLAGTTPASAATPKTGHYQYKDKYAQGNALAQVDFDVVKVGQKLKVKNFSWITYSCSILSIPKALTVTAKGKFKFEGMAQTPGTAQFPIKVTGKFTSQSKAVVSAADTDDAEPCEELDKVPVKLK